MSPPKSGSKADADAALTAEAAKAEEAALAAAADAELDAVAADGADAAEAPEEAAVAAEAAEAAGLEAELEAAVAQRDDYLLQLQRQRAEFQNYRRRVETERRQQVAVGVSRLVESLLPVLDGCEAAAAQGHAEVDAVGQSLMVALGKAGLERIDAVGEEFDPTQHEAVIFEQASADEAGDDSAADAGAADGDDSTRARDASDDAHDDEPDPTDQSGPADLAEVPADGASALAADAEEPSRQIVVEELRSGYRFDGRVLRAAMVKVRTG